MQRTIMAAMLVLLLVSVLSACGSREEKKQKFMQKGKTLYEQADYVKATLALKNALQIDPQFADAYYLLGQIALKQGDLRKAYGALTKATTINPGDLGAQLYLGKILLAGGAPDRSLEKADLVLTRQPGSYEALLLKAGALLARKETEQAQAILIRLRQQGKNQPQTYLMLAHVYLQQQNPFQAEKILLEGAGANPDSVEIQFALADLYTKTGHTAESERALRRLIELQPHVIGYKLNLAGLYWEAGRKDEAVKVLNTPTVMNHEEEFLAVSGFYFSKRRPGEAERILQEGLVQHPRSLKLRLALAEIKEHLGQNAAAIGLLKECLSIYSNPKSPQNAQTRNALAKAYLAAGDIASARRVTDEALQDHPRGTDLRFTAGRIALKQGDYDRAVGDFRIVITDKPAFIPGYLGLAEAHAKNGQIALALDTLLKTQRTAPRSADVLFALAKLYAGKQDYPQAVAVLQKIEEYYPGRYAIQTEIGDLYARQKDYTKAARAFRQIRDPQARYLKLAQLAAQQGQWSEALAMAQEGYRLSPQNPQLLNLLVELHIRDKQPDKAAELCQARLLINDQDALAHYLLGRIALSGRHYAQAETSLHKAILVKPDWPEPYALLARLFLARGEHAEAVRGFENTLLMKPKNPVPYLSLAAIYEQDGAYLQARRIYEQALAVIPDLWPAANNLAFILSEHCRTTAELDQALTLARQAQRSRPDDPAVMDTLGWVHFRRGELESAKTAIQSALDKDRRNALFNYHMGMILVRTGEKAAAIEHLHSALRNDAEFPGRSEAETALKRIQL